MRACRKPLWVAWLRVRLEALAWLGQISYSIYLFHLVVLTPLIHRVALSQNAFLHGWPIAFYVIAAILLATVVSAAVYYAVELSAINLGKASLRPYNRRWDLRPRHSVSLNQHNPAATSLWRVFPVFAGRRRLR